MGNLIIKSNELQKVEPLLQQYFNYQPVMLIDEINECMADLGVDFQMKNSKIENGILTFNPQETFDKNPELQFIVNTDYCEGDIITELSGKFNKYFSLDNETGDNYIVLIALAYISK